MIEINASWPIICMVLWRPGVGAPQPPPTSVTRGEHPSVQSMSGVGLLHPGPNVAARRCDALLPPSLRLATNPLDPAHALVQ